MNDRRIKFRVWNKRTNKWIHGPHEHACLDGVNLFGETILLGAFMDGVGIEELNDCVDLQFTNLKDKNGKEIFEGDIVKGQTYTYSYDRKEPTGVEDVLMVCEYDVTGARFLLNLLPLNHGKGGWDFHDGMSNNIEVIGNIFDNPELLK